MLRMADNVPARIVRIGGCLVVAALIVSALLTESIPGDLVDVVFFAIFGVGFIAVTGRSVAVPAVALATGAGAGVLAAVLPGLLFMLRPPIPHSGDWAFAVVAAAGLSTVVVVAERLGGFRLWEMTCAGLLAAVVAPLSIWLVVVLMAHFGPASWVPSMESGALTVAARLAERRHLAGEPYLWVLLVGLVAALILAVLTARRVRRRGRPAFTAGSMPPDGPRQIELGEV